MLLCAPSLGILDNWLPVLHAARASHPDWRIVALIPDRETLTQLDPSDTAHVLADEVIDATVAPLHGGGWVLANGFLAAPGSAAPMRLFRGVRTRAQRQLNIDPSELAGPHSRLLYDIHLHEKARLAQLLEAMGATPRFSHNHGIEREALDAHRVAPTDPHNVRAAFLYDRTEANAYTRNFSLGHDQLLPVGMLRHERTWVNEVVKRSQSRHELPFNEFVFVVSRPAGSSYLPRDRKVEALRAIHEVAWKRHGIPLVLRTHPKEHEDGTLREALPSDSEGVSWARSRAHPFHLATKARAGITFLSGVAVDLVALRVPVIEFLDVRGLPVHDHHGTPRDDRGRLMFSPYRRDGIVLPADDRDDLRSALDSIISRDVALPETTWGTLALSVHDSTAPVADVLRALDSGRLKDDHR